MKGIDRFHITFALVAIGWAVIATKASMLLVETQVALEKAQQTCLDNR